MNNALNPDNLIPLYMQIKNSLMDAIRKREFKPNDRIPGEKELESFFHVSRITIRKAISELVDEGILVKKQGKGTFLSGITVATTLDEINGYTQSMLRLGYKPGRILIERNIISNDMEIVKKQLGVAPNDKLVHIKRVLLADEEPVVLENAYYPIKFKFFMDEDLNTESMYNLLKQKMQIIPFKAQKTIGIELANEETAMYLKTKAGTPLLVTNELVFEQNETPIHYSISRALSDKIKIRLVSYASIAKDSASFAMGQEEVFI
ncbi:MAG: GntR family transcriptional regulator [Spirochaetaceae bacterium]|jgi:GntR family transcriptional regulator|nr:GntR family transcriptional regulator [Spirochaetaceae bacterium]